MIIFMLIWQFMLIPSKAFYLNIIEITNADYVDQI
jgi:hypothetical protein